MWLEDNQSHAHPALERDSHSIFSSSNSVQIGNSARIDTKNVLEFLGIKIEDHMEGFRRFLCPICSKILKGDKCDIKRHLMVHSGQKPRKCPHCAHTTITIGNLNQHIKQTHGNLGSHHAS